MAHNLHLHPLFQIRTEFLSPDERISVSYKRARLLLQTYKLNLHDVQFCTPRYWALMRDPLCSLDFGLFTVLELHTALFMGSLSRHLPKRPDLRPLWDRLLCMDTVGLFLLTERGHGLDSFNIETTATKTASGFVLHSPREEAWKFMPATNPSFGVAKVALVMAKLIVAGEDRGGRLFIVPICNERREMYRGVCSMRLPPRSGTSPLDFSLTRFEQVQLPPTALLSSDISDLSAPARPLEAWWDEVWRLQLGSMAVTGVWVSSLKILAFLCGRYSRHRTILAKGAEPFPIITFRTQQWPILQAIALSMVLDVWFRLVVEAIVPHLSDTRVQHALSIIVKATICRHVQRLMPELGERCGAQGTFEQNHFPRFENDVKTSIIGEGDIMTISIKIFSELLQCRYSLGTLLPAPKESLLASHATALIEENSALLKTFGGHRSAQFEALVLPQCQLGIESIGHAMAYSAAVKAKLPQPIIDLYECAVIRQDPAWYLEHGISRMDQRHREDVAISSALPHLDAYLNALDIEKYVSAPILSDAAWKKYVEGLPTFTGNAVPEVRAML